MQTPTKDSRAIELYHLPKKLNDALALQKLYERTLGYPPPTGLSQHRLVAAIVSAEFVPEGEATH